MIICDDQLVVWGPKRVLTESWKSEAKTVFKDGVPVIKNYFRPDNKTSISVEKYKALNRHEKGLYCPQKEREYKPENIDNCIISLYDNNVQIRINKLFHSAERVKMNRYKNLVEVIMDIRPALIPYTPREGTKEPLRAFKEASRNILINNFSLQSYEVDIFIEPEEGRVLRRELKKIAEREYENTIYIKEKKKGRGNASIKMYDEAKKTGEESRGEFYKLEITLRKEAFKTMGLQVQNFTFQDGIFKLLYKALYKQIDSMQKALREKGGESMVLERIKAEMHREENMLINRVMRLEKEMLKVNDRLDMLEKAKEVKR